ATGRLSKSTRCFGSLGIIRLGATLIVLPRGSFVGLSRCFFIFHAFNVYFTEREAGKLTLWRRGRDSNPRGSFRPPNDLANRPLQPAWVPLLVGVDYQLT